MAVTLTGNPKTPAPDNDDGFVYPHDVKTIVPNLDTNSFSAIRAAIVAHTSSRFNLALELYGNARLGRLTSGETIDLYAAIPDLERVNLRLAASNRTGYYLA